MEKFSDSAPDILWFIYFCLNISGSAFESSFSYAGIDEINRIPSPTEILERNTSPDSGIDTIDVEFTEPKTAVEAIKGKKIRNQFYHLRIWERPEDFFHISYFDRLANFLNILTRHLGTGICNYNVIVEFKTGYIHKYMSNLLSTYLYIIAFNNSTCIHI